MSKITLVKGQKTTVPTPGKCQEKWKVIKLYKQIERLWGLARKCGGKTGKNRFMEETITLCTTME